jgi:hypothetical protein
MKDHVSCFTQLSMYHWRQSTDLDVCNCAAAVNVPRPTGHVPGLAVAKAMVENFEPGASIQLVEVFIYPGDGDVIITALAVGCSLDVIKSGCQPRDRTSLDALCVKSSGG